MSKFMYAGVMGLTFHMNIYYGGIIIVCGQSPVVLDDMFPSGGD